MPGILSKRSAASVADANDAPPSKSRKCSTIVYEPRWPHSRTLCDRQLSQPYCLVRLDYNNCIIHVPNFLSPDQLQSVDDNVLSMVPAIVAAAQHGRCADQLYFTLKDVVHVGDCMREHSDTEMGFGLVAMLSLGQCRYVRIRRSQAFAPRHSRMGCRRVDYGAIHRGKPRRGHRDLWHFPVTDNSLVIMYGPDFQHRYSHEVPRLPSGVMKEPHRSIKWRFTMSDRDD